MKKTTEHQFFTKIKTVRDERLEELIKFSKTPLHDQDRNSSQIFLEIEKNLKKKSEDYLIDAKLKRKIMGAKDASGKYWRKSLDKAEKIFDDFLVYEELIKDRRITAKLRYRTQANNSFWEGAEKALDQEIESKNEIQGYLDSFYLEQFRAEFQAINSKDLKNEFRTIENLDLYYFAQKLKYAVIILLRSHVEKKLENEKLSQVISETNYLIDLHASKSNRPYFDIYIKLFSLFSSDMKLEESEEFTRKVKAQLNKIHFNEFRDICTILKNYYSYLWKISKSVDEKRNARSNFLDFVKFMGDEKLLQVGKYIPPRRIKGLVSMAVKTKNRKVLDWAEQFVKSNSGAVAPEYQQEEKLFNLGAIEFYRGNFNDALNKIELITDKRKPYFYIDAKAIRLRAHYEIEEYSKYVSEVSKIKSYIKEADIHKIHKLPYLNFFEFIKQLMRMAEKSYGREKEFMALKQSIENLPDSQVYFRDWLLEKLK